MAHELADVIRHIDNISCIEGDESNLFIGTTNGTLLHYVIHRDDPSSDSLEFTYLLASKQDATGGKAAKSIVLLAHVQLAAVLADETLSFYTLPEFAPASGLRVVKDVRGIAQNEDFDSRIESDGSFAMTIFTRKKIRQLKISSTAIKLSKELEYSGCLVACQRGSVLCVATKSSYDLVDLDKKTKTPLFPVVQGESDPSGPAYKAYRPRITNVTTDEFLVASGSPESPTTMGMFITKEGEITRGTLMFGAYPWKLFVQYPYVLALLSNQTIEVHNINTQELLQTLLIPGAVGMTRSTSGVPVIVRKHMEKVLYRLNAPTGEEKPALPDLNLARRISDVFSNFLVYSPAGVRALVTQSAFMNIDATLDTGDLQSGLAIAEMLSRESQSANAERLYHELSYIHQKAGLSYFDRMLFDDAIDNFKKGNIDPRILISFFPEYTSDAHKALIYSGVYDLLTQTGSVDQIILKNLSETVDDSATLQEMQVILKGNALELLRRFLSQFRDKKGFGSLGQGQDKREVFLVVEEVLLLLLLQLSDSETDNSLQEFFKTEVDGVDEIVAILRQHEKWQLLADLCTIHHRHREALDIWKNIYSGAYVAPINSDDCLTIIKDYLLIHGNDVLIFDFGVWLLQRSLRLGLELYTKAGSAGLINFKLTKVLDELRVSKENNSVFFAFLEYLVVDQKVGDLDLTNELIHYYGRRVLEALQDEHIKISIVQSINTYRVLPVPKIPYLTFISEIPQENENDLFFQFNKTRARFIDLLQSSEQYDAQGILDLVLVERSILLAERILLYGRLSNHADSLNLLVHDLKDFDSAEVYCYHGGISLSQIRISSDKTETVIMRRKLFPLLFKELLSLEDYSLQFMQGATLLNRWGNYMDIAVILVLIPDHWSVELVSDFLIGSLAQLAGEKREAQIRRSLTRTQLERTAAKTYVCLD